MPDEGAIALVKRVNSGTPAVPVLEVGAPVTWTYLVTNPGTVPLSDIALEDDAGTPLDPSDDFGPIFVDGDTDGDGLLDPGETWTYVASGTVEAGTHCNIATVEGDARGTTVSAQALACYQPDTSTLPPPARIDEPSRTGLIAAIFLLAFIGSWVVFRRREVGSWTKPD